jgi:hypothetical protein
MGCNGPGLCRMTCPPWANEGVPRCLASLSQGPLPGIGERSVRRRVPPPHVSSPSTRPTVCPSNNSASLLSYQSLPTSSEVW